MSDKTIVTENAIESMNSFENNVQGVMYIVFNKNKILLKDKTTLGRDSENDIVVDNKLASRHHAVIEKIKNAFFIKDCSSTNGTFINGSKIPSDKYIKLLSGDKITIGSMVLVIS